MWLSVLVRAFPLAHCSLQPVAWSKRPIVTFQQVCAHLFLSYLSVSDGIQIHGLQLPCTLFILPEVSLTANQDDWYVSTEVLYLWVPLGKKKNIDLKPLCLFFNIRITFFCNTFHWKAKLSSYLSPTRSHGVNIHMQAGLHSLIMTKRLQQTQTYQTLTIIHKLKVNCKPETPV